MDISLFSYSLLYFFHEPFLNMFFAASTILPCNDGCVTLRSPRFDPSFFSPCAPSDIFLPVSFSFLACSISHPPHPEDEQAHELDPFAAPPPESNSLVTPLVSKALPRQKVSILFRLVDMFPGVSGPP